MKKAINYIKIPSLCLAGLIAGSALLSACNAPEETTTTTTEETTEIPRIPRLTRSSNSTA